MTLFTAIIISGTAACLATTAGIYAISVFETKSRQWSPYFTSFAAGVLIAVSFLHLIPKAMIMFHTAGRYFLLGFIGLYLLEQFMDEEEVEHSTGENPVIGRLAIIGMGFHSLIDGAIYSITFTIDMLTGLLSSIGMVLHEFPEGVIMYALLQKGGFNRKKSILYAFLATGLTTPLGAIITFPFFSQLTPSFLARFLAISTGFLLYLATVHLLPMTLKKRHFGMAITFFLGILLAMLIRLVRHV